MPELLIVDLEATCWERGAHRPLEMETIEIGALRIDLAHPERVREFQCFVRPVRHPALSAFCTRLTTIRQEDVAAAEPFARAFPRFVAWLGEPRAVLFSSWGEYDRLQFVRDCVAHGVAYPFHGHWNLKRYVAKKLGRKPGGMDVLLAEVGLTLEGTHHRGLDDARNLWRLLRQVAGDELGALLEPETKLAGRLAERGSPAQLSRFLALVLRHRAGDFGLAPDGEGFVPLDELVAVVERHAVPKATRDDVLALLRDARQERFERRDELVRARYGHARSQPPVAYAPAEPPPTLYHGTSPAALAHVLREGLRGIGRQYVHLATSAERARVVAARRTRAPVLLAVDARRARAAGVVFHVPEPHHYLARAVPAEFLARHVE